MPRRLLGESRDQEAAAPPPRGNSPTPTGTAAESHSRSGPGGSLGDPASQHRRAPSPRSIPGFGAPGSLPAAASAARSPSPASQDPPPHPPAAVTGRYCGQSQTCACGFAPNPRRLKAGLRQSHPGSSWGRKIPFVWESQAGIEPTSLPGGSTFLWSGSALVSTRVL